MDTPGKLTPGFRNIIIMKTSDNTNKTFKNKIRHLLQLDRPQIRIAHRVRTSRAVIIGGILLGGLMLLITFLRWDAFFASDRVSADAGRSLFICATALAVLAGLTTAIRIYLPIRGIRITTVLFYILIPFLACLMSESICGIFIYNFSPLTFGLNYLLFLLLYSLPAVFFGRIRQPILIITPLIWLMSMTASYVLQFRGTPLMPADLVTIRTGMEVAGGYNYAPQSYMILGTWIFLEIMLLAIKMPTLKIRPRRRNMFRVFSLLLLVCTLAPFYLTEVASHNGIRPDFWNQARGYANRGTLLSFTLNTRYLIVETPNGYDPAEIDSLVQAVLKEEPEDPGIFETAQRLQEEAAKKEAEEAAAAPAQNTGTAAATEDKAAAPAQNTGTGTAPEENSGEAANTGKDTKLAVQETSDTGQPAISARLRKGQTPNIIVIMNESLADLRVLGEFSTNIDYFPFIRNLTRNTIKGNLYMPVTGAGTSNSEFEFLTGSSMALLPAGSNAYQLYVDLPLPSFTRTLKAQNYSAAAYHTYYKAGWKRNIVYPLLGFDQFIALEDDFGEELVNSYRDEEITFYQYQNEVNDLYPDSEQILMRRFVSDRFDYEQLIRMYEERDRDKPFYLFNVTMQNHGGYSQSYLNFEEKVYLTSTDQYYSLTNRFLSLMYESDQALEDLIGYFSTVREPTMIVVFGDHEPGLEPAFLEEIMHTSLSNLTVEETQRRFTTPFLIWTNYRSQSGYIDKISANYLSTLVLQQAGLKTSTFNDYLSALYGRIPVINPVGYISRDNLYYTFDNETRYNDLIDGYKKIEYNYLFDSINRDNALFTVTEKEDAE